MTDDTAGNSEALDDTTLESATSGDATEAPEDETETADETDLDAAPEDGENGDDVPTEDEFEVEHEGEKFRIPAKLKDLVLMRRDYSKKTEDLANDRKAFEQQRDQVVRAFQERQAGLERLTEASKTLAEDRVNIGVIEAQLAGYDQLIRQARERARSAADFTERQNLMLEADDLADQKAVAAQELAKLKASVEQKETEFASERATALTQERQAAIEKGILDLQTDSRVQLTPEKFKALSGFGAETYGYTGDELHGALADPRMIRTLYDAARAPVLEAKVAELNKQIAALKKGRAATDAQPARRVGGTAGSHARRPTDASGDGLTADEWRRRRLEQKAAASEAERKARYGS